MKELESVVHEIILKNKDNIANCIIEHILEELIQLTINQYGPVGSLEKVEDIKEKVITQLIDPKNSPSQ